MKKNIAKLLLAALLLLTAWCAFNRVFPASTLLLNGKIYTVNPAQPWATAVLMRGGKIQAVGDSKNLKDQADWRTTIVDIQGLMAMPGLHDAHMHLVLGALAKKVNCELAPQALPAEIVTTLKHCQQNGRMTKGWLIAGNYDPTVFPNNKPSNEFLNQHFPNTPVYIDDFSLHAALVNQKALDTLGLNENVADPELGYFGRHANGKLNGLLSEGAKMGVFPKIPQPYPWVALQAVRDVFAELASVGTTSLQDAVSVQQIALLLSSMDRLGMVNADIQIHWPLEMHDIPFPLEQQRQWLKNRQHYATKNVHVNGAKLFLDGVPLPPVPTHATIDSATGKPDPTHLTMTEDALTQQLTALDADGIKVKVHAVGDGAARVFSNALARSRARNGNFDIVHDLAHAQGLHPQDRNRPQQIGGVIEFSPTFWAQTTMTRDIDYWFKTANDSGALVTVGTDWPVVPNFSLFPALAGMLQQGDESLDLASAIRAFTINGAKSVGRSQQQGSIKAGKWANVVVLDRNLFESSAAEIAETQVQQTYFKGKRVH